MFVRKDKKDDPICKWEASCIRFSTSLRMMCIISVYLETSGKRVIEDQLQSTGAEAGCGPDSTEADMGGHGCCGGHCPQDRKSGGKAFIAQKTY